LYLPHFILPFKSKEFQKLDEKANASSGSFTVSPRASGLAVRQPVGELAIGVTSRCVSLLVRQEIVRDDVP
jgi:hypothetical protein